MLEVKNLSVRYGRHHALDRVSVTVDKGEVCVILGAKAAAFSAS
jgi:branched-chain amino acid transport system ATP-binding protein